MYGKGAERSEATASIVNANQPQMLSDETLDKSRALRDTTVTVAVVYARAKQRNDTLKNGAQYKSHKSSVYGMSPEKHAQLRAIGNDPALQWASGLSRIASETDRYLDRLARCVAENKSVDEAVNFCRWLQFSGVLKLPHPEFVTLRNKADSVLDRAGEIYKGGKVKAYCEASAVDALNAKMDFLLTAISQAKTQTGDVVDVQEPRSTARLALRPAYSQDA
jgi:hypothetical protein